MPADLTGNKILFYFKITKKEQELELAAQLGKEMLAENDSLRKDVQNFQKELDNSVKVKTSALID